MGRTWARAASLWKGEQTGVCKVAKSWGGSWGVAGSLGMLAGIWGAHKGSAPVSLPGAVVHGRMFGPRTKEPCFYLHSSFPLQPGRGKPDPLPARASWPAGGWGGLLSHVLLWQRGCDVRLLAHGVIHAPWIKSLPLACVTPGRGASDHGSKAQLGSTLR